MGDALNLCLIQDAVNTLSYILQMLPRFRPVPLGATLRDMGRGFRRCWNACMREARGVWTSLDWTDILIQLGSL